MNKTSLMREVEGLVERGGFDDDLIDRKEVVALIRQLDEPATNASATHLSEQLKTVQEDFAMLIAAKDEKDANGESERYHELKRNAWGNARIALSLLPAIIEGVEGLEQNQFVEANKMVPQVSVEVVERVARALYELCLTDPFRGQMPWEKLRDRFPDTTNYYYRQAKAAIAAIQHPEGEK